MWGIESTREGNVHTEEVTSNNNKGEFKSAYNRVCVLGVKFEAKIPQIPCLGGEFCIMTKRCLGVYFQKLLFTYVHLHIGVPPGVCVSFNWDC